MNGQVWSWGDNSCGQCGLGYTKRGQGAGRGAAATTGKEATGAGQGRAGVVFHLPRGEVEGLVGRRRQQQGSSRKEGARPPTLTATSQLQWSVQWSDYVLWSVMKSVRWYVRWSVQLQSMCNPSAIQVQSRYNPSAIRNPDGAKFGMH